VINHKESIVKILVMHGPNLNLLGTREPAIYGTMTLEEINTMVTEYGEERGAEVATYQSNHEGSLIDAIHVAATDKYDAIVFNPGAYTHTSMAIADAIRAVAVPVIEVHLSNLFARGPERAKSVTAAASRGLVSGFGHESYLLGIDAALRMARSPRKRTNKNPSRRRAGKKRSSAVVQRPRS
jgi:3-dehydroquinate dehydratase-2